MNTLTLGDALPKEIQRVRELIEDYKSVGPAGIPATMMMQAEISAAEKAISEGDTVQMLRLFTSLKGWNS